MGNEMIDPPPGFTAEVLVAELSSILAMTL